MFWRKKNVRENDKEYWGIGGLLFRVVGEVPSEKTTSEQEPGEVIKGPQ